MRCTTCGKYLGTLPKANLGLAIIHGMKCKKKKAKKVGEEKQNELKEWLEKEIKRLSETKHKGELEDGILQGYEEDFGGLLKIIIRNLNSKQTMHLLNLHKMNVIY